MPVEVNGATGEWIFDTGANISTVTDSEARRMGLAVRQSKAWVGGSTDKRSTLRLAGAGDLGFRGAHIHNELFFVLADQTLNIGPMHCQITGIPGLPVMRALGRVGIAGDGQVQIRPRNTVGAGEANLDFRRTVSRGRDRT